MSRWLPRINRSPARRPDSCGIWHGVFIGQTGRGILRLEQALEFDVIEADQIEIVILLVEYRQFDAKHFFVPSGARLRVGCRRSRVLAAAPGTDAAAR